MDAEPPARVIRAASVASLSVRRAPNTTVCPCSASDVAMAAPILLLAPVARTTLVTAEDRREVSGHWTSRSCPTQRNADPDRR